MDTGQLTSSLEIGGRRASWQSPEPRSETTDERRPGAPGLWPESSASDCCCCLSEETHRRVQSFVERKKILLQALTCAPVVADATAQRCAREKSGEICEEQQGSHVVMPPLETFMLVSDIGARRRSYLSRVQPGDLVCGSVATVTEAGLMIALLCCDGSRLRLDLADLKIVAFCAVRELPRYYSHESPLEAFSVKDKVRGVVTMADPETGKMQMSMLGRTYAALGQCCASSTSHLPKLGLISDDELPQHYSKQCEQSGRGYSELLASSAPFNNPHSSAHLCDVLGLSRGREGSISAPTFGGGHLYSLLNGLSSLKIPLADCASSLRKEQSRRMALKSVATGVRYFKEGKYTEAAQCYYKALNIDDDNVEALVARGALFANNESYSKAIEDFDKALRLLPNHPNARSYLVQTLLAYGREFEATGNNDRAKECFVKAQTLDPTSVDAKRCVQQLESKVERDAFTCAMPPPPPTERASAQSASAAGHALARVPRSSQTEGGGTCEAARAWRETASGTDVAPFSNGAARRRSVAELGDGRTLMRHESVTTPVSEDRHRTKRQRSSSSSSGDARSSTRHQRLDGIAKARQSLEKHRGHSGSDAASKCSSRSSSAEPRLKKHRSSKMKHSSKRRRDSSGSGSCSRKSDDRRRHRRKKKRKTQKRKKGRRSGVRSKSRSSSSRSGSRSSGSSRRSKSPDLPEQRRHDRRPSLVEPHVIEDSSESGRFRDAALSAADSQCISKRDTQTVEHSALHRAVSRSSSSSGLQSWPEKDAETVRRSSNSGVNFPSSSVYNDEGRHSRGLNPNYKSESRDVVAEDVSRVGCGSIVVSPSVASTQDSRSARLSQDSGMLPSAVPQKQDRSAALMEMELFLQQLKQKKKVAGSAL